MSSVLRAGIRALVGSPLFVLQGDFYCLALLSIPSSPRREDFWTAGFWCALHMVSLCLTPDPVSPWLFFAVIYGRNGLPSDLDYIRALDPTSANKLEPWFKFRPTDTLHSTDHMNPVRQLLVSYLDIHDVSIHLI